VGEQGNPTQSGPMAEAPEFEQTWDAAQRGDNLFEAPPPIENAPTPPVAEQRAETPASDPPAPAAVTEPAPSDWTPPTRETWEETQQKARRFDSFQGNFPKIEERWTQEKVAPLEQELNQLRADRERLFNERQQAIEASIRKLPYEQQDAARQRIAALDQETATRMEAERTLQAREQQAVTMVEQAQAVIAENQRIAETSLRNELVNSFVPFTSELAKTYGIPEAEVKAYMKEVDLEKFVKTTPDLQQVGPLIYAVEKFAATRGQMIASENASRAQQSGTYRSEGSGAGTGGQDRSVNNMPDKEFDDLWAAVMARNHPNR
jgi:hypothetical protein